METLSTPPNPFVADGALAVPSFEQWFFLPGDWGLYLLASRAPAVAEFLGIGAADYGGTLAGFLAWIIWLLLAIALIAATSAVRRFDRTITRGIADGIAELKRRDPHGHRVRPLSARPPRSRARNPPSTARNRA